MPKPLHKRLKYYRPYIAPGLTAVRLKGYYAQTQLDGDKEAYRGFLHEHAARPAAVDALSISGGTASEDGVGGAEPSEWATPMRAYDATVARRVGEMRGRQN